MSLNICDCIKSDCPSDCRHRTAHEDKFAACAGGGECGEKCRPFDWRNERFEFTYRACRKCGDDFGTSSPYQHVCNECREESINRRDEE